MYAVEGQRLSGHGEQVEGRITVRSHGELRESKERSSLERPSARRWNTSPRSVTVNTITNEKRGLSQPKVDRTVQEAEKYEVHKVKIKTINVLENHHCTMLSTPTRGKFKDKFEHGVRYDSILPQKRPLCHAQEPSSEFSKAGVGSDFRIASGFSKMSYVVHMHWFEILAAVIEAADIQHFGISRLLAFPHHQISVYSNLAVRSHM